MNTGIEMTTSTKRISAPSIHPPPYPAAIPTAVPMTMVIRTEENPTPSDTRDPQITRLSTSRPSWSLPNRCAKFGGPNRAARTCAFGSYGASCAAKTAARKVASSAEQPTTTRSLVARRSINPRRRGDAVARSKTRGATAAATSAIPDPRIRDSVQHVGDEVANNNRDRAEDGDRQDDRVVAREHRVHCEAAHSRQREYVLHHYSATNKQRQEEPGDGDDRK